MLAVFETGCCESHHADSGLLSCSALLPLHAFAGCYTLTEEANQKGRSGLIALNEGRHMWRGVMARICVEEECAHVFTYV